MLLLKDIIQRNMHEDKHVNIYQKIGNNNNNKCGKQVSILQEGAGKVLDTKITVKKTKTVHRSIENVPKSWNGRQFCNSSHNI